MTDNHSDTQATAQQKLAPSNSPNSQDGKSSTQTLSANSSPSTVKTADEGKKTAKPVESPMKMVHIAIADNNYGIFCPVHEEEELRLAVHYINNFATGIRKDAPKLSQEDLLVLTCLNLYEKIHDNQQAEADRQQQSEQTEAFLNKVIKDAQSIL